VQFLVGEDFSDRERLCERCKTKPAVLIFDRTQVCPHCYTAMDAALLREGGQGGFHDRKPPARAKHAEGEKSWFRRYDLN
jgi:hypothetical protein